MSWHAMKHLRKRCSVFEIIGFNAIDDIWRIEEGQ